KFGKCISWTCSYFLLALYLLSLSLRILTNRIRTSQCISLTVEGPNPVSILVRLVLAPTDLVHGYNNREAQDDFASFGSVDT
uniref:Uncharacterized protein n=2 Tax=Aegilops tauschii subsp. strangulata TaxID=200361 RepID=A0A453K4L0_AEGTS